MRKTFLYLKSYNNRDGCTKRMENVGKLIVVDGNKEPEKEIEALLLHMEQLTLKFNNLQNPSDK